MTGFELNTKFNFQTGGDDDIGGNVQIEDCESNEKSDGFNFKHNDIILSIEKGEVDKTDPYGITATNTKHIFRNEVCIPKTNRISSKHTIGIEDPDSNFKSRGDWLPYNGASSIIRRHSINGLSSSRRSLSSKCTTPRKFKSSEDEAQNCISSFHRSLRLLGLEPQDLGLAHKDKNGAFNYSKPVKVEPTFRTRLTKRSFSLENLRNAIQENHSGTQDLLDRKTLCNAVYEEWYFRKQKEAYEQKTVQKMEEDKKQELLEKFKKEQKLKVDENFSKWKEQKSKEKQKKINGKQDCIANSAVSGMPLAKQNQEEVFLLWKKQKDKMLKKGKSSESEKRNKDSDAERKASAQIAYTFWKKRADETYREKQQERKRREEEKENEKKRKQLEKHQIAESAFRGWQRRKNLELRNKMEKSKLKEAEEKDDKSMQEAERLYDAEQAFEVWLQKIEERRNMQIKILHRKRQNKQMIPWSPGGSIHQ